MASFVEHNAGQRWYKPVHERPERSGGDRAADTAGGKHSREASLREADAEACGGAGGDALASLAEDRRGQGELDTDDAGPGERGAPVHAGRAGVRAGCRLLRAAAARSFVEPSSTGGDDE